ncbi:MAG: ADP-ribosylglycohydrolase family protein [Dictyoglomus sp.]|nr:ADP-ribosylglycohydrolase family protein [Dictyoglomus sp.]MDW8189180.1 ADP-ribosylglycohydrolase family protein [Dictyoglomus sp.]
MFKSELLKKFRGCLIGGAIGDALGYPVEFLKREEILKIYGNEGITDLIVKDNSNSEFSDDTQMTLFTAEGILIFENYKIINSSYVDHKKVMYHSYLRWLYTQGFPLKNFEEINVGFLIKIRELYKIKAPGKTCISALSSGKMGTLDNPINNSKGCGGVMRIAPCGLAYPKNVAFDMAVDFSAITHGHPTGYLAGGALAYFISAIIDGLDLEEALMEVISKLKNCKKSEELVEALIEAYKLSKSSLGDISAIPKLGQGFTGEEALSISLYCALKYRNDFRKALISAVNHDGDSDSTGAITGNILGAYLGIDNIPKEWIQKIELKDVILKIADDLFELSQKTRRIY